LYNGYSDLLAVIIAEYW